MTVSANIVYSNEAIKEIEKNLKSKSSVIGPRGNFLFSADTLIAQRVMRAFTGPVVQ